MEEKTLLYSTYSKLQNSLKDSLHVYCTRVSEWFYSKKNGETIVLLETDLKNFDFIYVLHKELRSRFYSTGSALWTWVENNKVSYY